MKRRMWPVPRKCRASSTTWSSLTPRLTTAFTLTPRPAAEAASIPSSTRLTGKPTSFMARNVASSSESRLTVTRWRPAATSASAFWGSSAPFVVSATSRPPSADEALDQHLEIAAQQRLAAGDPDLLDAVRDERAREPLDLLEA